MSYSERHAGIGSDVDRERADLHAHFQPYPTVNSSLCEACQVIVSILSGERKYCLDQHTENRCEHSFQPSAKAFFDSAQAGCPLCILVWEVFSTGLGLPFSECPTDPELVGFKYWVNSREGIFTDPSEPYWLTFFAHSPNDPIKSPRVQVHGSTVNEETLDRYEPTANTGDAKTLSLASKWLQACTKTHVKCFQSNEQHYLPTRVLDVGTVGDPQLHLIETDLASDAQPYATLSHCWGQVEFMKLKKDNFRDMVQSITISELPKTFRDAVVVTRRLGIPFLWIDSLCIIQDSPEDWATESSSMRSIYKNCLVNIAATAAVDGSIGCFFDRVPVFARPCRIRVKKECMHDFVASSTWLDSVNHAPLYQRAWVIQEQLLAPRVLHFGEKQVFWECNELDACEMFQDKIPKAWRRLNKARIHALREPGGFGRLTPHGFGERFRRAKIYIERQHTEDHAVLEAYYIWNVVLGTYSRCLLSHDEDKLVAISGLVKEVQSLLKDDYVVGFWKKHLVQQLLWEPVDSPPPRPNIYRAPSWSWASVNVPITPFQSGRSATNDLYEETMVRLLEVRVDSMTEDTTSRVSGGYLKLRCWLKTFRLDKKRRGNDSRCLAIPGHDVVWAHLDDDEDFDEKNIYCLPVLETRWGNLHGLLLFHTGGRDEFRRIGKFDTHGASILTMFRRPLYPSNPLDKGEKIYGNSRCVRQAYRRLVKNRDWVERVITII